MTRRTTLAALLAAALAAPAFAASLNSGLKPGDNVTPFHPRHLAGPLAGTSNCFPCTFQQRPQVQVWVNGDDPANIVALAKTLGGQMKAHEKQEFKAMVVVLTDGKNDQAAEAFIKKAAALPQAQGVDMALLAKSDEAVRNYSINTQAGIKNTVFVYKNWTVAQKFVNLKADAAPKLVAAIDAITR